MKKTKKDEIDIEEIDKKVDKEVKTTKSKKADKKVIGEKEIVSEDISKKSNRTSFNIIEVIVIMVITALFGALVGSSVTYFANRSVIKTSNPELKELVATYNEIIKNYYGKLNEEELLESGIKGMIDYLDDPYSSYLDGEESVSLNEKLEGEYVGLGAEVTLNDDGNIVVATIYEKSPASKAGLKPKDVILKIGKQDTAKISLDESISLIKGEKGTKVKLRIRREQETLDIEFTRGVIETVSVKGEVITKDDKKIGLISIGIFAKNSFKQFKSAYEQLEKEGIDSLIIDVRGNTGGYVATAKDIASMFLKEEDVIFIEKGKKSEKKNYAEGKKKINIPVALLINRGTASASEILASALSENINAELVGIKTYGKGSVQRTSTLSSGSTIKYTTERWLTPSGKEIEGVGLTPTVEIALKEDYFTNPVRENDNQLQKAIEILKEK